MADIERLHYYERQFLGALDFEAQQTYHRDLQRRHSLGQHTWGIAVGLELIAQPSANGGDEIDVFISAGMAIDGFGREVILTYPVQLDLGLFEGFTATKHYEVWLAYTEELAKRPAFGYEQCDLESQFSRVRETYRVLVGTQPKPRDPIIVDGKAAAPLDPTITPTPDDLLNAIPDDQSVPYQEFPDDEYVNRWLIRLGSVRCDPLNGMLLTTTPEKLAEDRRYVGVIAEDVYAPAAVLKLRPRAAFADPDAADFARVEGRLQVDGRVVAKKDVLLHGGKLSFQGLNGDEDSVPLWMQRIANSSGYDLRIHIGDQSAADHRLTVGPTNGGVEQPVLAVRADDKVEILTGSLDFDTDAASRPPFRQMINLRKTADGKYRYGVGVQTNTTYFRSNAEFCWFKGGDHADGQSDPGGGALQLRLDDVARLHFGAQTRQMLNLWSTSYGFGVQSSTLYSRSNADFAWFRKGTHSDNRGEPGAGGVLAMKLDNSSNLTINGSLTANGSAILNGGKLELREADGGTDTDIMQITRQRNSSDHNDLRLIIGDNNTGDDRLVVGPIYTGDGQFKEQFVVANNGNTTIAGSLIVKGSNNLMRVHTSTQAWSNDGANDPHTQSLDYSAVGFVQIYAAYVVMQGYSLWNYDGQTAFTINSSHHNASANNIVQHVYARLVSHSLTAATVETYCSESSTGLEGDNTVLFTLVVLGRTAS